MRREATIPGTSLRVDIFRPSNGTNAAIDVSGVAPPHKNKTTLAGVSDPSSRQRARATALKVYKAELDKRFDIKVNKYDVATKNAGWRLQPVIYDAWGTILDRSEGFVWAIARDQTKTNGRTQETNMFTILANISVSIQRVNAQIMEAYNHRAVPLRARQVHPLTVAYPTRVAARSLATVPVTRGNFHRGRPATPVAPVAPDVASLSSLPVPSAPTPSPSPSSGAGVGMIHNSQPNESSAPLVPSGGSAAQGVGSL